MSGSGVDPRPILGRCGGGASAVIRPLTRCSTSESRRRSHMATRIESAAWGAAKSAGSRCGADRGWPPLRSDSGASSDVRLERSEARASTTRRRGINRPLRAANGTRARAGAARAPPRLRAPRARARGMPISMRRTTSCARALPKCRAPRVRATLLRCPPACRPSPRCRARAGPAKWKGERRRYPDGAPPAMCVCCAIVICLVFKTLIYIHTHTHAHTDKRFWTQQRASDTHRHVHIITRRARLRRPNGAAVLLLR